MTITPSVDGPAHRRRRAGHRRRHRRVAAAVGHGPVVPRRPRRPVEPRRGGDGARPRRPDRRGRTGLRLAGRPCSGPTAPGTSTTWPTASSRTSSTPTSAPTWPPASGTTGCSPATPASLETMWPVVERAIDFVLDLQTPRGEILWARHTDGTPWSFALLTGSSSICHSLRCAIALAEHLGHERPDWELSAARLAHTIRHAEADAFAPKHRWAMDWYYPVLCGVRRPATSAGSAWRQRFDAFVMEGRGVRCVERPAVGHRRRDVRVPAGPPRGRRPGTSGARCSAGCSSTGSTSGRYWTGTVYPDEVHFPADEQSTYTAASVVLAADGAVGHEPGIGAVRRSRRGAAAAAQRRRGPGVRPRLTPRRSPAGQRWRRSTLSEPVARQSENRPDASARW